MEMSFRQFFDAEQREVMEVWSLFGQGRPTERPVRPTIAEPETPEAERVLQHQQTVSRKQPSLSEKLSWLKSDPESDGDGELADLRRRFERLAVYHATAQDRAKNADDRLAGAYTKGLSSKLLGELEKDVDDKLRERIKQVIRTRGYTPSDTSVSGDFQGILSVSDADLKHWLALMGVGEMNWTLEDRILKAMRDVAHLQDKEPYRKNMDNYDFFKTSSLPRAAARQDSLTQKVLELKKQGYSIDQIGVELGLKRASIITLLRKHHERTNSNEPDVAELPKATAPRKDLMAVRPGAIQGATLFPEPDEADEEGPPVPERTTRSRRKPRPEPTQRTLFDL